MPNEACVNYTKPDGTHVIYNEASLPPEKAASIKAHFDRVHIAKSYMQLWVAEGPADYAPEEYAKQVDEMVHKIVDHTKSHAGFLVVDSDLLQCVRESLQELYDTKTYLTGTTRGDDILAALQQEINGVQAVLDAALTELST